MSERHVSEPASESSVVRTSKPIFKTLPDGGVEIRHREFWHDEGGSTDAFSIYGAPINPGLEEIFPWLGAIAARYEKYRFRKLVFRYAPVCPTSTPGYFAMAVDMDVSDETPNNRSELLAMENAVTGPAWTGMEAHAPLQNGNRWRYTRVGAYPTDTDPRTSDCGKVFLAKGDQSNTSGIGSIWVEYVVELSTPQLHIDPPSAKLESSESASSYFITPATLLSVKQINTAVSVIGDNALKFQRAGNFRLLALGVGSNPVPNIADPTITNGGTAKYMGSINNTVYCYLDLLIKAAVGSVLTIGPLISGSLTGVQSLSLSSYDSKLEL